MEPKEIIENECQTVNAKLKSSIDPYQYPEVEFTSQIRYNMLIDPIGLGYHEQFVSGDFDAILQKYREELYNEYVSRRINLGLEPKETFEEYMGPKFKNTPLLTKEELEKKLIDYSKSIENLINSAEDKCIPDFILKGVLEARQKTFIEYSEKYSNKEYCITQEQKLYRKLYLEKQEKYLSLFKYAEDII